MHAQPLRIAVLASGRGSNFAALLTAQQRGELSIDICALLSDKASGTGAPKSHTEQVSPRSHSSRRDYPDRASFDRALFARAAEFSPDLIVLAGYMRVIDADVVDAWHGRMINIHPSLLPKYPGLHTHQRAIEAGDAMHGTSVHFVTAELDGGPVIAQAELPILAGEDADTLAARLLPLEHRLLIATTDLIAQGEIAFDGNRILHKGLPLQAPLLLNAQDKLAAR